MFTQHLFTLVTHLIFSRLARGFTEHHGACETAYAAHIGPLCLEVNQSHVLDHEDVAIGIQLPIPLRQAQGWVWGKLEIAYLVCRGEEQIRKPGFNFVWWPAINRNRPKQTGVPEEDFPF
jgi:hypothetical protein